MVWGNIMPMTREEIENCNKRSKHNDLIKLDVGLSDLKEGIFLRTLRRYEIYIHRIVIVIDPGHGVITGRSIDHGAVRLIDPNGRTWGDNVRYQESDIVLDISKKLKISLENIIRDVEVYLTRETELDNLDNYSELERPPLDFRWKFANDKNADYLISIHCNSSDNSEISGFLVCYDKQTEDNIKLSEKIITNVTLYPDNNKGHRWQELRALRGFEKEAVLIELGYISNDNDVALMTERAVELVNDIAQGIKNYIEEKEKIIN